MSLPPSPSPSARQRRHRLSESYLLALARDGPQDAFAELVRRHDGFIRHKAKSFFLVGADSDDLIQAGVMGLDHAVRSYRPDRDGPFGSYAELQIMRSIIRDVKHTSFPRHQILNEALWSAANTSPTSHRNDEPNDVVAPGSVVVALG